MTTRSRALSTLASTWKSLVPCSSRTSKSSPMEKNFSLITYMGPIVPRGGGTGSPLSRRHRGSRLQDDLDAAVLLLLEHVVGLRRLLQRHPVRRQVVHAQRVVVTGQQRQDVVHPLLHVRLAHPQGHALVEEVEHRE